MTDFALDLGVASDCDFDSGRYVRLDFGFASDLDRDSQTHL